MYQFDKPIIVTGCDIETTGLSQEKGHRIIEISLMVYKTMNGADFTKIGEWTRRINPLRSIDPGAQNVHKISIADLHGEPEWEDVAPHLIKLLNASDLLVGHNGNGFDFPFIALEIMRIGMDLPNFEVFDTMLEGRDSTGMGKVPSLQELCFAYDEEYDTSSAHAADYDTEQMMKCFFKACKWGQFRPEIFEKRHLQKTEAAA